MRLPTNASWALGLALLASCRSASPAVATDNDWTVRVVIDDGDTAHGPRTHVVAVAADATALEATRGAVAVAQGWVCCSEDDVWAVDGLASDPARDGYWSWWLDGELGPGFAHQVRVSDGATVEWRYSLADPEGRGAEPVARVAALSPEACAAIEAFGGGRNLVAHGAACRLVAHRGLPSLSPTAAAPAWRALELDVVVDGPALAGARTLRFAPGTAPDAWDALGEACGRRAAARAACAARERGR